MLTIINKLINKDQSSAWYILAAAALLVMTAETAVVLEAARENRSAKAANTCIEERIGDLQREIVLLTGGTSAMPERGASGGTRAWDRYIEKSLTEILSPEKLRSFAKSFWSYELFAGDPDLPLSENPDLPQEGARIPVESWKEGFDIEVPASGNLYLRFIQTEKPRALPLAVHRLGNLTGGDPLDAFETHLAVSADREGTMTKEINGLRTIVSYTFAGLRPGRTIRIDPDPVLASFLTDN